MSLLLSSVFDMFRVNSPGKQLRGADGFWWKIYIIVKYTFQLGIFQGGKN